MKKNTLAALALLIVTHSFAGPDIRQELLQSFHKNFPNAGNVHWEEDVNGYAVEFMYQSIFTRITYDRKGHFTGSLRNYPEQFLPLYIADKVKQEYRGQDIFGVTEVSTPLGITYFIKLKSDKNWTTVQVDHDGGLTEVEKYERAD